MNSYHKFSHNSFHNSRFTWAQSITPRSPMVDTICKKCGTHRRYPSGELDVSLEGGSSYPDVLGCGAFPFAILSENAIQIFMDAGINSFHTFEVGIKSIESQTLEKKRPPRYFWVEIDGHCRVDVKASGANSIKICKQCNYIETDPMVLQTYSLIPGSWDGSPLFRDDIIYPFVNFCTQEVVDLVKKKKLTNFRFRLMGNL